MKRFKLQTQELRKRAAAYHKTFLVCFLKLRDSESVRGSLSYHQKERLATLKRITCRTVDKPPLLYPSPPLHPHHPCITSCGSPTAPPTVSLVSVTAPPPTTLVSVVAGTEVIYLAGC